MMSTGRLKDASICDCQRFAQQLRSAPAIMRMQCDTEQLAESRGRSRRCRLAGGSTRRPARRASLASRSVRSRSVTDLPMPAAPLTNAKPPSPASCSTRQQKDSMRGVSWSASTGTSEANGLHFRPYRASSLLVHRVSPSSGGSFIGGQIRRRQPGRGLVLHQLPSSGAMPGAVGLPGGSAPIGSRRRRIPWRCRSCPADTAGTAPGRSGHR